MGLREFAAIVLALWVSAVSMVEAADPAPNSEAQRIQGMIEDARAMVKEDWEGYRTTIESIKIGYECDVLDELSASVAIRKIQIVMEDVQIRAGLLGDPTLNLEDFTSAAIRSGKDAADKGACTRMTPASRARLRTLVGELMQ